MDFGISGKLALVTGATAGIGLAIAEGLVREGANVVITGRSQDRLDKAVSELQKTANGVAISGVKADHATAEGAKAVTDKHPHVDILVNNVGIYKPVPFAHITDAQWNEIFDVNIMSAVRLCRFYFPEMLKKNWGRVVFISSESGVNTPGEMIHYGLTKTAQLALSRGLAEMTKGTNVTVNSVLPGPTMSEGVEVFIADMAKTQNKSREQLEKEFFEHVRPSSLIQRFATNEEVANMVVYTCSQSASATNGAALRVEGGCLRSII
jgi:NAD(P)-dependent dehydrogenase (short-subunit alcohol dehydrogenase family)